MTYVHGYSYRGRDMNITVKVKDFDCREEAESYARDLLTERISEMLELEQTQETDNRSIDLLCKALNECYSSDDLVINTVTFSSIQDDIEITCNA